MHLSCQVGVRIVEYCKLQPSLRDAATSCVALGLGLLFPAKQAACVVYCLPWHVRKEEKSVPTPSRVPCLTLLPSLGNFNSLNLVLCFQEGQEYSVEGEG